MGEGKLGIEKICNILRDWFGQTALDVGFMKVFVKSSQFGISILILDFIWKHQQETVMSWMEKLLKFTFLAVNDRFFNHNLQILLLLTAPIVKVVACDFWKDSAN